MMHWDTIVVAVIAAVPGVIAALLGRYNSQKIGEVHLAVNSRMDELLDAARRGAFGEGQQQEREKQERKDNKRV